ncbi:hypothetical protein I533_15185 [Alteromonas mediterranea MED64]|uniref:ATP-binding protein n=1 Tax=Alteromonas mediterranea TaxID=314275 RepID=UPI00035556E0|nr:ATP-binding protein [Alteromonas mediterranea]AGP81818.1 hypothetical protein I533_09240 [Alteromonas mediterranea MED64]AGP82992.1 hypothetical protein I533_15185 [Alteromonas mediterranea MED64]
MNREFVNQMRSITGQAGRDFIEWLRFKPEVLPEPHERDAGRFYETGDQLIQTVLAAIERRQHVVLYGPRGCGKSYCIGEAIKRAERNNIIVEGAWTKVQGNKEMSRDALIEDDIILVTDKSTGGNVLPDRKGAPLLRRVNRDDKGRPKHTASSDKATIKPLELDYADKKPFVLFLDEINRFSDGILDSLLLLLEEGQVAIGENLYQMDVIVCMTMNPPGYDASARTLSPPLAARIGQSFRLRSPSLDVLSDVILRAQVGDEEQDWSLLRRAALVTLCCWGDPNADKPGLEYLSGNTRDLLSKTLKKAKREGSPGVLQNAMATISELCNFGPDGRALGDWYSAAYAEAKRESLELGYRFDERVKVKPIHFDRVSVRTLGHKIQDAFAQATNPGKLARKENAIRQIAHEILTHPETYNTIAGLKRKIDNQALLEGFVKPICHTDVLVQDQVPDNFVSIVRNKLLSCGLSGDKDLERWSECFDRFSPDNASIDLSKILKSVKIIEPSGQTEIFRSVGDRNFAQWIGEHCEKSDKQKSHSWVRREISEHFKNCVEKFPVARSEPLDRYLESLSIVQAGLNAEKLKEDFEDICKRDHGFIRSLGDELDILWHHVESDDPERLLHSMSQRLLVLLSDRQSVSQALLILSNIISRKRFGQGIKRFKHLIDSNYLLKP